MMKTSKIKKRKKSSLTPSDGAWRQKLTQEMKSAGLPIDESRTT